MLILLVAATLLLLSSCAGPEIPDTPGNAVVRTYNALTSQDSIGYLQCLARQKREVFESLPDAVHALLVKWKGQHANVQVLSATGNDTLQTVIYNLTVTGPNPMHQDSIVQHVRREADGWKEGY